MALHMRSQALSMGLLSVLALFCANSVAFLTSASRVRLSGFSRQSTAVVGGAALLSSVPQPAHAGGMFDFGFTLPFVAITFLTMMAVLNALWYGPVTTDMDDRNAKLLLTLSDATDMLTKADEIQIEYTEQIRTAREKASQAVAEYRKTTETALAKEVRSAAAEREAKASEAKAKLDSGVQAKMQEAEAEIERRKIAFVKETLAAVSL
eukprot:CAMPEP_0171085394 /NCGR_PEP_ID=MMETSP0766_2-20121228/18915_1 /TAXON_ID=439317 /ORGANISM="Gambierdiscus australes, Strain CAWD 149" /LENGTH=207 /DNA_ID=CAMNT_0011542965 /DNA_START=49 /DNA_END=672 /DNA_ORIENTATION=-